MTYDFTKGRLSMNRAQFAKATGWSSHVFVAFALTVGFVSEASGGEARQYVLRDGRKVPMDLSENEIGIVFRSQKEAAAAAARARPSDWGVLEKIPGSRDSRFRVLRMPKADPNRKAQLRGDPGVLGVGNVYRFAGSGFPVLSVGRVVLKLRPQLSEQDRQKLWQEFQLVGVQSVRGLHDVYTARVDEDEDEAAVAERLAADSRTLWANPDLLRVPQLHQEVPLDEFFDQQWHLNNTGQDDGTVDADIDALEAWAIADGEGVLFGMLDTGCDVDHEDLRQRYIGVGQNVLPFFGDADDPRPKFFGDRHGTAVMGLAVADKNTLGVRGVSFASRFTASSGLEFAFDTELALAYPFALEQGVDIHINSWGFPGFFGQGIPTPPVLEDAVETAALEGRDPDGEGEAEPLGMLIFFSSGNQNRENKFGFALSALPNVISVGASDRNDVRSAFSSFGESLNFVAPGEVIATTDNEDGPDKPDQGYNIGGFDIFGFPEIDPGGNYTGFFGGTSAACPIAAGVAGLVLSVNDQLTADDVRLIMEHTCDKISPGDAEYNGITGHSLTYGHGRVNAHRAVLAAQDTLQNGGLTWPDKPSDLSVLNLVLSWRAGLRTNDFLIVQAQFNFNFVPEDGVCYDDSQPGCETSGIEPLPEDVSVLYVGCTGTTLCEVESEQNTAFVLPAFGRQFFGIYGRDSIGRYSFGAAINSDADTSGGGGGDAPIRAPAVTISASPLEGISPLTVEFNGNAVGDLEIDGNQTRWDFDVDDDIEVDATVTQATHTYIVAPGETKRFSALLSMVDVIGNEGFAGVQIRVTGPTVGFVEDPTTLTEVSIDVDADQTTNEKCQTDVCGTSPFDVLFGIDTAESNVALAVQSVVWDLGDGTTAASQSVFHTYVNTSDTEQVLPVTATITFLTAGGATVPRNVTKLITVLPGGTSTDPGDPNLPGTDPLSGDGSGAAPCGVLSIVPLLGCVGGLFWFRRRER